MDISGKILQLLPVQTGQGRNGTWKKQEFILETGDTYPKKVCIAVWGDKVDMSSFQPGDMVDVSFDVESREFNGRWYTDVKAWKVNKKNNTATHTGLPDQVDIPPPADDDLPF
mgnify:CR=1 FL=1|jgi:Ribosomal protein S4 and related proteins